MANLAVEQPLPIWLLGLPARLTSGTPLREETRIGLPPRELALGKRQLKELSDEESQFAVRSALNTKIIEVVAKKRLTHAQVATSPGPRARVSRR